MNHQLPIILKCRINGIKIEICNGEIPDAFRSLHFNPVTEFELPDTKASDEEFQYWLYLYRHSNDRLGNILLKQSQCN